MPDHEPLGQGDQIAHLLAAFRAARFAFLRGRRRSRSWQLGQKYVDRPLTTIRWITGGGAGRCSLGGRRQSSPSRP
jgi:hypothetical protein